jgi:hypothetical protein
MLSKKTGVRRTIKVLRCTASEWRNIVPGNTWAFFPAHSSLQSIIWSFNPSCTLQGVSGLNVLIGFIAS